MCKLLKIILGMNINNAEYATLIAFDNGIIFIKKGYHLSYLLEKHSHTIAKTISTNAAIHIDTHNFFGINLANIIKNEVAAFKETYTKLDISDKDFIEMKLLVLKDLKENSKHFQPVNGKVYRMNC